MKNDRDRMVKNHKRVIEGKTDRYGRPLVVDIPQFLSRDRQRKKKYMEKYGLSGKQYRKLMNLRKQGKK